MQTQSLSPYFLQTGVACKHIAVFNHVLGSRRFDAALGCRRCWPAICRLPLVEKKQNKGSLLISQITMQNPKGRG
ncbi:hypothetical protein GUJ93_ZPchr0014g47677 [Zizania palustris]|uniref:Uncharacterized protein n=1 Tax=Zizania palustris TaxID=103762 RepID=A0A8J5W6W1_ZIZPA|nr:hypothetical protein GUJ93_ZPchr0014g47677 [Zizania palustris]